MTKFNWDSWEEWDKLAPHEQEWLRTKYSGRESKLKAELNCFTLQSDQRNQLLGDFLREVLADPATPQIKRWCRGELVMLMSIRLGQAPRQIFPREF